MKEYILNIQESAISLRDKVATVIRQVEEHWNCDMEMEENEKNHILKLYRETMLQAYNFGFEVINMNVMEAVRLNYPWTDMKLTSLLFSGYLHGFVIFIKVIICHDMMFCLVQLTQKGELRPMKCVLMVFEYNV